MNISSKISNLPLPISSMIELIKKKEIGSLDNNQIEILLQLWEDDSLTYEEIAGKEEIGFSFDTAKRKGSKLWQLLTEATGERINKGNFKYKLIQYSRKNNPNNNLTATMNAVTHPSEPKDRANNDNNQVQRTDLILESPESVVPLNSRFYIDRQEELLAYQAIKEPGEVIRIVGKRKSGASSLITRLRHYAQESLNYHFIYVNFSSIDREHLKSSQSFMHWFCEYVSEELLIPASLNNYWKNRLGPNQSSKSYFKNYLLKKTSKVIVIILDRIDCFFEEKYQSIASDFFALIRSCYETRHDITEWNQIKYIIAQNEQEIITGTTKRSPFNIGQEVRLLNFSNDLIIDLARRYQLDWSEKIEIKKLIKIFGKDNIGHPHLIRQILYYITKNNLTFENFIQLDFQTIKVFKPYLIKTL